MGVRFVTPRHFSGPKSLHQRISLHVERVPLSLQSSKGLVVANLTEVWAGFLLVKGSRGPAVEMTGL